MRPLATPIIAGLVIAGMMGFANAQYQYPPQRQPAAQADVKTELKTAVTHAGFAAGGDSVTYVVQHLGHALNCLEGAKGRNFNQSWGNVCEGQGNGILEDLKAARGGADFALVAEATDTLAATGVKNKKLGQVRMAAKGVAALLNIIADNLK